MRGLRDEEFDLAVIEHRMDLGFAGFDRFSMPDDEMLVVSPFWWPQLVIGS